MTLIFINGIDFFPFVCFLFSSCANTILFSLNEEIPSELKGERVGTLEIGFLCNLKNVQLPSIYFDFFFNTAYYLSVWISFWDVNWIESVSLLDHHHHPSGEKKFLIELIVKWILIPFLMDILFMTLFQSVTFSTSMKNTEKSCETLQ